MSIGFVEEPNKKPVLGVEVANVDNDWTRKYIGEILYPEQDTILTELGGYDLKIYEKILRDDRVKVELTKRFDLQKSWDWEVEPASEDQADVLAADWVRELVGKIQFDNICDKMLYAVYFGYSVAELMLVKDEQGLISLDTSEGGIKIKNRRRFRFDKFGGVRLLTRTNLVEGEVMAPSRVWRITHGGYHDDDPYGMGLGYWLYWLVTFKRGDLRLWLDFLERQAKGVPAVEYPETGDKEKSKAEGLKLAQALYNGRPTAYTAGTVAKFIENSRSATGDYQALYEKCNDAISEVIVGQTLATQSGGSQAQGRVHQEVLEGLVKSDADTICQSFSEQVIARLCDWNFSNTQPPKIWRKPKEEADLKLQGETDKLIFEIGYRPTAEKILKTYGNGYEAIPAAMPPISPGNPDQTNFTESIKSGSIYSFGEGDKPSTTDLMIAQMRRRGSKVISAWSDQIEKLLDQAEDLAEFKELLPEIFPELDPEALQGVLEEGIIAARMAGVYESEQGLI